MKREQRIEELYRLRDSIAKKHRQFRWGQPGVVGQMARDMRRRLERLDDRVAKRICALLAS